MAYYNATGKEREEDFLSSFRPQTGRAQGGESKNLAGKLGASMGTQSPGAEGGRKSFTPSKPTKPSKPKNGSKGDKTLRAAKKVNTENNPNLSKATIDVIDSFFKD